MLRTWVSGVRIPPGALIIRLSIKGLRAIASSSRRVQFSVQSILIFTVHKAASMFLHRITERITGHCAMPYYSVNLGNFESYVALNQDPGAFAGKQGCFGPLRGYVAVPGIDEFGKLLHLRDPRDVLTSGFHSKAYNHPVGKHFKASEVDREVWREAGVDHFVLERLQRLEQRYAIYCRELVPRPDVTLLKYEEMVADFPSWLEKFIEPFPVPNRARFTRQLVQEHRNSFRVKSEDVYRHRRQITPGDYLRKLQPDTIDTINETLAEVLTTLGYD